MDKVLLEHLLVEKTTNILQHDKIPNSFLFISLKQFSIPFIINKGLTFDIFQVYCGKYKSLYVEEGIKLIQRKKYYKEIKVGCWVGHHQGLKISSIFTYKKEKRDGLLLEFVYETTRMLFYKNGFLEGFSVHINNGIPTIMQNNGENKYLIIFKDGIKKIEALNSTYGSFNGYYTSWYKNGLQESEGFYKNGYKEGYWIFYYRNGNKEIEGNYKKSEKEGIWTIWRDDLHKKRKLQQRF